MSFSAKEPLKWLVISGSIGECIQVGASYDSTPPCTCMQEMVHSHDVTRMTSLFLYITLLILMWHDATHSYMTRTLDIWWVVSWHRWVVPCHMWPASSLARGTSTRDTVCHVSHKCYMTWVIFHTRHPMTSSIDESCHVWRLMSRDSTRDDVFAWLIHVGRLIHGDMTSYHSCMGRLMWSDTTRDDSHTWRRSDVKLFTNANFQQVFTGVHATFKQVFTVVPKKSNNFARK